MNKKTVKDIDLKGKRVFMRVDFNVPMADGKEVKKMGPTPDDLYGVALSRDGKAVATSGYAGNVTLWNLAEGKPANIVEKMVEGGVQKFLKEVTLLGQPFVKNDKQTVDQLLKASKASISAFVFYVVGEGIEKKKDDFVAEVMAQVGQAG